MDRDIIIADRDAEYSRQVVDHFTEAGYRVDTAGSTLQLLESILEKNSPVLLLGRDFDPKLSSADLIHLVKKCNPYLCIIVVSEEMPLAQERKIRQEGIFYYALKPALAGDTEELGMAVACAFHKNRTSVPTCHLQDPQKSAVPARESHADQLQACLRIVPRLAALLALALGAGYLFLLPAAAAMQGGSMAVMLFLGFCGLIFVTQVLPIFRIKLPGNVRNKHLAKQQGAYQDKK